MNETAVIAILAANFAAALGFALFVVKTDGLRGALACLLTISLIPVVGVAFYLVSRKAHVSADYDLDEDETIRRIRPKEVEYTDPEQIMRMVPANDALSLSSISDRRAYMLSMLRNREMNELRGALLKAVGNEDSEASHYAASALMELQRLSYQEMEAAAKRYAENPNDYQNAHSYARSILEYLANSEIGQLEYLTIRERYEAVMLSMLDAHAPECSEEDYGALARYYIAQSRYEEAARTAQLLNERLPGGEAGYMLLLENAYLAGDGEMFKKALSDLRGSGIPVSAEGMAVIRLWSGQRVRATGA